jgi:hypothetical protein
MGHIYRTWAGKVLHTGFDTFVTWRKPTTRMWGNRRLRLDSNKYFTKKSWSVDQNTDPL